MPPAAQTAGPGSPGAQPKVARKLILCFDGTGNTFSGTNADTNVVKLLNKMDRNDPTQFHYYQTGIGTYDVNATAVDQRWLSSLKSSIDQTLDSGFGSGFDTHVLAGYRFLMRYYESGDKIYMFGFSRGAFTAKFLARMVNTVGLLCKGNEEMVPFAYQLYQRSLAGKIENYATEDKKAAKKAAAAANGTEAEPLLNGEEHDGEPDAEDGPEYTDDLDEHEIGDGSEHQHERTPRNELEAFSNSFCRKESVKINGRSKERNIKVFFLGLWDCVSSVAVLEQKAPKPLQMGGTAEYIRHAVAVDERRVKFKATLFAQDETVDGHGDEDIKEVWFPGCHGDVGGGWPASSTNPLDSKTEMTFWQRLTNLWTTRKPKKTSHSLDKGPFQMSDVPLAWMIREIKKVGRKHPESQVRWRHDRLIRFEKKWKNPKKRAQALDAIYHDSLRFGYGSSLGKVMMWKFLEWFPLIKRWEFVGGEWKFVRWPLNKGSTRDIPADAELHQSLVYRLMKEELNYAPTNNHGEDNAPCLKHNGVVPRLEHYKEEEANPYHQTWKICKGALAG